MPQIGTKGTELDLLIRQGATFGPVTSTLKNPDQSPVDLTGCIIRAQIKKTPNSPTSSGIVVDVNIDNPTSGTFIWGLTADQTASFGADPTSETAPSSVYVWDMELQDASGRILPLLYGNVNVFREVTKA